MKPRRGEPISSEPRGLSLHYFCFRPERCIKARRYGIEARGLRAAPQGRLSTISVAQHSKCSSRLFDRLPGAFPREEHRQFLDCRHHISCVFFDFTWAGRRRIAAAAIEGALG